MKLIRESILAGRSIVTDEGATSRPVQRELISASKSLNLTASWTHRQTRFPPKPPCSPSLGSRKALCRSRCRAPALVLGADLERRRRKLASLQAGCE